MHFQKASRLMFKPKTIFLNILSGQKTTIDQIMYGVCWLRWPIRELATSSPATAIILIELEFNCFIIITNSCYSSSDIISQHHHDLNIGVRCGEVWCCIDDVLEPGDWIFKQWIFKQLPSLTFSVWRCQKHHDMLKIFEYSQSFIQSPSGELPATRKHK